MATLRTGLNTFQPLCFTKSRQGILYFGNGVDRPGRFDGIQNVADADKQYMGITAPTDAPTVNVTAAGGGATAGAYSFCYRFTDDDKPSKTYSSMSSFATLTAVASDQFRWSGLQQAQTTPTAETVRVKFVELWRTTAAQTRTIYFVIRLGISGTITSTSEAGGTVTITSTVPHGLSPFAVITISGTLAAVYDGSKTVLTTPTDYTFTIAGAASTTSTGSWILTGYGIAGDSDEYTDAVLAARESMLVTNSAGTHSIARRQGVPPSYKPYLCMFQDRMWMAGMLRYTAGTVTVSANSDSVTGTSTAWTSGMVGQYMAIAGDTVLHEIEAVNTGTQVITLVEKVTAGFTGVNYVIKPRDIERLQLWYSEQDEPESMSTLNTIPVQQNTGDDDEITGLVENGGLLLILMSRHVYALTYFSQPEIDADVSLKTKRGCINNRCWARYEDKIYLMDTAGIWAYAGGAEVDPISDAIGDLFRDGTISWTNSKYFFATTDFKQQVVRFHVQYAGDSGTLPQRWLEYNVRNKTWVTGRTTKGAGGSCTPLISGRPRLCVGFEDDGVMMFGEGLSDLILTPLAGTATNASSAGDLRSSSSIFTSAHVGLPLYFYSGTGRGMYGYISAYTSGTQVAYTSLTGTFSVNSTTKFIVGAIYWNCKTGKFTFPEDPSQLRRHLKITYDPTTDASTVQSLDIQRYINHSSTAETFSQSSDPGRAVTRVSGDNFSTLTMSNALYSSNSGRVPGLAIVEYRGRLDEGGLGIRFEQFLLRGYQAFEQPVIHQLEILGVKEAG